MGVDTIRNWLMYAHLRLEVPLVTCAGPISKARTAVGRVIYGYLAVMSMCQRLSSDLSEEVPTTIYKYVVGFHREVRR